MAKFFRLGIGVSRGPYLPYLNWPGPPEFYVQTPFQTGLCNANNEQRQRGGTLQRIAERMNEQGHQTMASSHSLPRWRIRTSVPCGLGVLEP
jgi:hypothetical protein